MVAPVAPVVFKSELSLNNHLSLISLLTHTPINEITFYKLFPFYTILMMHTGRVFYPGFFLNGNDLDKKQDTRIIRGKNAGY
jgi:hypothetical protein